MEDDRINNGCVRVAGLEWATENLAVTPSGRKEFRGTGHVIGDFFQWASHPGHCGEENGGDNGLTLYTSFLSRSCGDSANALSFKECGMIYCPEDAPYRNGGDGPCYTKYTGTDMRTVLEAVDDPASVILGEGWRMPTRAEFQALRDATFWAWDEEDRGYYVFGPEDWHPAGSRSGVIPAGLDKGEALLFFPAAGCYSNTCFWSLLTPSGNYWSSSLYRNNREYAYDLFFISKAIDPQGICRRHGGMSIRPVRDCMIE